VLLALGGCAASSDHHDMLRAIARVMLDGAIPDTTQALDAAVQGIEVAIEGLPPAVQGEIGQLFGLLEFPLTVFSQALVRGVAPLMPRSPRSCKLGAPVTPHFFGADTLHSTSW